MNKPIYRRSPRSGRRNARCSLISPELLIALFLVVLCALMMSPMLRYLIEAFRVGE